MVGIVEGYNVPLYQTWYSVGEIFTYELVQGA